jgi:hypothetical protein
MFQLSESLFEILIQRYIIFLFFHLLYFTYFLSVDQNPRKNITTILIIKHLFFFLNFSTNGHLLPFAISIFTFCTKAGNQSLKIKNYLCVLYFRCLLLKTRFVI